MTDDPDLFGWQPPPPPPPEPSVQDQHLARVAGTIGPAVLTFVQMCGVGGQFHASDLHDFVGPSVAPASADRVLRELRRKGYCDYTVINRRASLYQVTAIA